MVSAGVFFYFAAAPLSAFFLGGYNSNVLPLCVDILHVIAFVMLPLSITMVLVGALRGAGDTRWPLVITLFGFLVVRVPLAIYFVDDTVHAAAASTSPSPASASACVGAWYAAITDVTVRMLLLSWRFFHGGWQHIRV